MSIKVIDENTLEQNGIIFVFVASEAGNCCRHCAFGCATCSTCSLDGPARGLCMDFLRTDETEGYFTERK